MTSTRAQWFTAARFGMFIHWGPYSALGRGEWVRSAEKLSIADYEEAVAGFTADRFDPRAWARLAREAGCEYAVLTAKHHDGYALFDSAHSTYTAAHHAPGRDLVREFLEAFRAEGLRVGLYFSLLDWYHPDYPAFGDEYHPDRDLPQARERTHDWDRYLDFMHDQVRELCTDYGTIDLLWFDFSYGELRGPAWRAEELIDMVRSLQPDVLIDNRLETSGGGFGSIATLHPTSYAGDFVSPEQLIPPGGIRREDGAPVPWEACVTTNNHWGFHHDDTEFKSADLLVRQLVECVSKGGNLLVNVGPDASGQIPAEAASALRGVGRWLAVNQCSVKGAGIAPYDRPEWGVYTMAGDDLFAHVLLPTIGPLPLTGGVPKERIASVTRLADGCELAVSTEWIVDPYPDIPFVNQGPDATFTYKPADPVDTVLRVHLRP